MSFPRPAQWSAHATDRLPSIRKWKATISAVPVLAELVVAKCLGEARESTVTPNDKSEAGEESRGGRKHLSGGVESRHAQGQRSLMPAGKAADVKGSDGNRLTSSSQTQGSRSSARPAQSL